jgi:hypothetical protein
VDRPEGSTIKREVELARRVWRHAAAEGFTTRDAKVGRCHSQGREVERSREHTAEEQTRLFRALAKISEDLRLLAEFAMLSVPAQGCRSQAPVGSHRLREWGGEGVLLKTKGPVKRGIASAHEAVA